MSRTNKTALNSAVGLICTIISSVLSFVLQAVFIRLLGLEYSGINSLFSNILNILNLAELGFNNAILFRLYKAIANNDDDAIKMYLCGFKKICYYISAIIGIAGICCIPFLEDLVKEKPSFPESLWSLYIVVLATSVISHALSYKNIFILAKQDRYIRTVIQYSCLFLCHGLQIVVLLVFKNIYIYLFVKLFTTMMAEIISGIVCKKRYKITWKSDKKIPKHEKNNIIKDVGSLSIYKMCRTVDASIDTFLISKFVAVATTAIYGSINMLLNALHELFGTFNDGMIASIGDLYASDKNGERISGVFYQTYHFTFLIYGISSAVLTPLLSGFVNWWVGYTLPDICIYIMLINFFMYGMGMNIATFRNSMGIFQKGWKRPGVTALLNLIFSFVLVKKVGLVGTLFGTTIARTLTLVWYDPYIVCKYGLKQSPWKYYRRYIFYSVLTFSAGIATLQIKRILPEMSSIYIICLHGIVYTITSSCILLGGGLFFSEQKAIIVRCIDMIKKKVK